jgi:hypothetical protein
MKNTIFFKRILPIIEFHNIKSVNSFAKDYLNYESSEKINRLKDENKKPSFEILDDISNKFESIDMNWLITGKGEMLRSDNVPEITYRAPITPTSGIDTQHKYSNKNEDANNLDKLLQKIDEKSEDIGRLKAKIEHLVTDNNRLVTENKHLQECLTKLAELAEKNTVLEYAQPVKTA